MNIGVNDGLIGSSNILNDNQCVMEWKSIINGTMISDLIFPTKNGNREIVESEG